MVAPYQVQSSLKGGYTSWVDGHFGRGGGEGDEVELTSAQEDLWGTNFGNEKSYTLNTYTCTVLYSERMADIYLHQYILCTHILCASTFHTLQSTFS